ncbi:MAG: CPBP family intramembrane metalloprotease, partial [Anaerolineae bacterium]|nr:CPBP family intramembrane metalloprotease [Anaerolineae bacterium]
MGLLAAAGLYGIFWLGRAAATALFPFAEAQIADVYVQGEGMSRWTIAMVLLFVTGPCEEIYWRGYLQQGLADRFGGWRGWLLGVAAYALAHIWSLNAMLIAAASVAGAFWGLIFWRRGNLAPAIVSHSLWGVAIFTLWPLG